MTIEVDREEDGRWLAGIPELPGVVAYGSSREEALALRVMADRLEHGETMPELVDVFSVAPRAMKQEGTRVTRPSGGGFIQGGVRSELMNE